MCPYTFAIELKQRLPAPYKASLHKRQTYYFTKKFSFRNTSDK